MASSNIAVKEEMKPEPGLDISESPSAAAMDEDLYEDAGDLDMNGASQSTYITRVPKYLWKYLSAGGGGQDGHIGTIRVEGDIEHPKQLSLLLYREEASRDIVPMEYNMQISQGSPPNVFTFTEQDLPGYSKRTRNLPGAGAQKQGLSASQVSDTGKPLAGRVDKNQRYPGFYRRTVPKKTAVSGVPKRELNCQPVENKDYNMVMELREQKKQPMRETRILTGMRGAHPIQLGSRNLNEFIKPVGQQRPKQQDNKATRMPQNELLDLIQACFRRYKFWPMKALRAELQQPEAYLKSTLELVATLVRQGPHALTWRIKPEFEAATAVDASAPEARGGAEWLSDVGDGGSDDEDSAKMEDVPM